MLSRGGLYHQGGWTQDSWVYSSCNYLIVRELCHKRALSQLQDHSLITIWKYLLGWHGQGNEWFSWVVIFLGHQEHLWFLRKQSFAALHWPPHIELMSKPWLLPRDFSAHSKLTKSWANKVIQSLCWLPWSLTTTAAVRGNGNSNPRWPKNLRNKFTKPWWRVNAICM